MAAPAQTPTVTRLDRESRTDRQERIYRSLPPLGSPAYLILLRTANAAELPPAVLVRVYRELHPSPAADATLGRLLGRDRSHGYLAVLFEEAQRRRSRLGGYGVDDLVCDTIGEIVATLAGPRGESGERAWVQFVLHCMEDACRKLVGRPGQRIDDYMVTGRDGTGDDNDDDDDDLDPIEAAGAERIPWQGSVVPNDLEWLENFLEGTVTEIADERLRVLAFDLLSETPTPVSSGDPKDANTLTGRFRVKRFTIYRLQDDVRGILRGALERQTERDIDLSFLKPTEESMRRCQLHRSTL